MKLNLAVEVAIIVVFFFLFTTGLAIFVSVRPGKFISQATPQDFGLGYEKVSLQTQDGVKIAGWYVPKLGEPSHKAVILLHGYPADKGDILPRFTFLAKHYNLFFLDFRYLGESGGSFSTAGAREVNDLLAALAYLKNRGMEKIGVYGFSLGGAVALMALAKTSDLAAVVSESAYAELRLMALELFRNFGPLKYPLTALANFFTKLILKIDLAQVSPAKVVAKTQVPILLLHSRDDAVIPFKNAEIIQASLQNNPHAEFAFSGGEAHGQALPDFEQLILSFFEKHLR